MENWIRNMFQQMKNDSLTISITIILKTITITTITTIITIIIITEVKRTATKNPNRSHNSNSKKKTVLPRQNKVTNRDREIQL